MASHEKIVANVLSQSLYHHQESEEDELSFCDLPIMNYNERENNTFTSPTSKLDDQNDLFEFLTTPETKPATETIVFCGKQIVPAKQPGDDQFLRVHTRKGFFIRRDSFKKIPVSSPSGRVGPTRSSSFRLSGGSKKAVNSLETAGYRYNRSGNGGSRKHKVIIGLVKFQPEMELSEIRKRQGRRSPAPLFPTTGSAGEEIGGRSHWNILRPLCCRSHFMSALTKASFGCLSHA